MDSSKFHIMHRITYLIRSGLILLAAAFVSCRQSTDLNDIPNESRKHIRARWSPDGEKIAFTATFNNVLGIYRVDTTGADLQLLHAGDAVGVDWSPDSRWIVFSKFRNLYKVLVTGDSLTQLTTISGSIRPAWSPDGKKIAFVRGDGVNPELFVLKLETMQEINLLFRGNFPSWHPNGRDVVVLRYSSPVFTFYSVDDSTFDLKDLESFVSPDLCDFSSMSPAGDAIVFARKPTREFAQVWKVTLSTGQYVQLTTRGADYPAWSPDGTKIVYTRTASDDGALWIMNGDGTGARRLTSP
jgi:TolB protein